MKPWMSLGLVAAAVLVGCAGETKTAAEGTTPPPDSTYLSVSPGVEPFGLAVGTGAYITDHNGVVWYCEKNKALRVQLFMTPPPRP